MFFDPRVVLRRGFWKYFIRSKAFSFSVGAAVVLGVLALSRAPDGRLGSVAGTLPADGAARIVVFDIGQGDAILVRSEQGDDILIDGGPDDRIIEKLGSYLPREDRDIELLVLTHPHADHLAGLLPVLDRYQVKRVVTSGARHDTALDAAWIRAVADEGVVAEVARPGMRYAFGGTALEVLAAGAKTGDLNDTSVVLRFTYGSSTALLMGDATTKIEDALLAASSTLRAGVLKIGHHGSKYSTGRAFLSAVAPAYAVISVGADNRYGHPSERTLKRLRDASVASFRTDEDGDVLAVFGTSTIKISALHDR